MAGQPVVQPLPILRDTTQGLGSGVVVSKCGGCGEDALYGLAPRTARSTPLGPDSGIIYQVLEANERIGGRLYTHEFEGHTPNDYYVGPPP